MKAREFINLVGCAVAAALFTFLAYRWGMSSYVEPTCRAYVEAKGNQYAGFDLPDWNNSGVAEDWGDCRYITPAGQHDRVSLYTASSKAYGPPFLVGFALRVDLMFLFSFLGSAFLFAVLTRGARKQGSG